MEPKEIETPAPGVEQLNAAGIGDDVMNMLDGGVPPKKDALPPPPAKKDDPPPPPAKKADLDPLSPEGMAAALPKKDDGVLPADLLKDDEVNRFGDKKQREAFIKERAAHKEARIKLQEMATRIQELQSQAADAGQVGELRKQLEAKETEAKKLSDELARLDLSRSPAFRKQYDDKLNQLGAKMVQTLTSEGVAQDEAANLVRALVAEKKPSAREYALNEAAPSLKGTVLALLTQFDDAVQARNLALEKARETAAAIDEAESRGRLAALAGKVDSVAEKAAADAAALGSPFYKRVQDNQAWNEGVDGRIATLKGLLLSGDVEKLAPYVAEGLTAADLRARYATLYKNFRSLEQEYQDVVGQAPNLGRIQPGQAPAPAAKKEIKLGSGSLVDDIVGMLD